MLKKRPKILIFTLVSCIVLGFLLFVATNKTLLAETFDVLKWGWVGNTDDNGGGAVSLVSFDSDNLGLAKDPYGITVETNPADCPSDKCGIRGNAWLGSYGDSDSVASPIGWLDFYDFSSPFPDVPGFVDSSPYWNPGTKQVDGWARIRSLHEYGISEHSQDDWGWVSLRGTIDDGSGDEYGVTFTPEDQRFSGWAWSGNGSDSLGNEVAGSGLGWIQFDLIISEAAGGVPYLEVQQGDVYSQGDVKGTASTPSQATYLILSGGEIINFESEEGQDYEQQYETGIEYPDRNVNAVNQPYISNIGVINPDKIKAAWPYGVERNVMASGNWSGPAGALDNQVYTNDPDSFPEIHINNNMTITHELGKSGNGTVSIYGDLYIDSDINYLPTPSLDNIQELPSVAWVVQGDIYIDPSVENISGVFIALGNDEYGTEGVIQTGNSGTPLTVYGAMFAHKFDFQRKGVGEYGNAYPAEKIIYDGRLIANPPPGLQDLAKTMPVLTETAP